MDYLRERFDQTYDLIKPFIFWYTEDDPKVAHELFVDGCRFLHWLGIEDIVLKHSDNLKKPPYEISNAAGFNKDAKIPPSVLKAFGFDRVEYGTITGDAWPGNERPSVWRYVDTESLANYEGLPGDGSERVAERINGYGDVGIPASINFMSTPKKEGDELLRDLENTIWATRDLYAVDRYVLNISCPNAGKANGKIDLRDQKLRELGSMLKVVFANVKPRHEVYVKVSPDSTYDDVTDTTDVISGYPVVGIVAANTTTNHDRNFIPESPMIDGKQVGGVSGRAVYDLSRKVQEMYSGRGLKLIAVGGIDSAERAAERAAEGADEIQIYTPIIFKGTKLLRELRRAA